MNLKLLFWSRTPVYLLVLSLLLVVPYGETIHAQQLPASHTADATQKFTVTVTDGKGRFVVGLTKEDFTVSEGKTDHALSYFNAEDAPASIALLMDVSGSIDRRVIDAAKPAVVQFIRESHPENEYLIGEFSSSLRELTGWTREPPTIIDALKKLGTENGALLKPKPKGMTAFYDASLSGLEKLAHSARHSKRVLLFITDGGPDNISKSKIDDVKRKIKESDVLLYVIAITERSFRSQLGQAEAYELANISGGRAYIVENGIELTEVVERLALKLRQQYVVGFTPKNTAAPGDKKWNKVKIKVTSSNKEIKGLSVRSRDGYYSLPAATP